MADEGAIIEEGARARVRRLLIDPLAEDGFRFKRGTDPEVAKKRLAQMADDLTYLSDRSLGILRASLRTKGEGEAKCFWPVRATVLGLAEALEPRPLEDMPSICSWFASKAGREALQAKRHIAEFLFWQRRKRPPLTDSEWRLVTSNAEERNRLYALFAERKERGLTLLPEDRDFMERYERLDAKVRGLIEAHGET